MPVANYHHLRHALGGLGRIGDEAAREIYKRPDPYSEASLKDVFRRFAVTHFEANPDKYKKKCKDSLRYFLTTREAPFERILLSQQDSELMNPPDPYQFFVWLWEVLFAGEDFHIKNLDEWTVDNTLEAFRAWPGSPEMKVLRKEGIVAGLFTGLVFLVALVLIEVFLPAGQLAKLGLILVALCLCLYACPKFMRWLTGPLFRRLLLKALTEGEDEVK